MNEGILFEMFIVFLLILLSPVVSRLLGMPAIVVETLLGILLGPSFFCFLEERHWLSAMALIGFIYLMFVVGLEVELDVLKEELPKVIVIALASFIIPFTLGYLVAIRYNLPPVFIGVALSTTSMGVVLPTIREFLQKSSVAQVLLGAAILVDVISMFALTYVVEERFLSPHGAILLFAVILSLFVIIALLRQRTSTRAKLIPIVGEHYLDVRICIALIFGFAVLAEVIGIHAIVGSFLAGLLVSELRRRVRSLSEKLLSFGYGFFIPIFFITVGVRTNLWLVLGNLREIEVLVSLIIVGFVGKILGAYLASRLVGFNGRESLFMGLAMSARLSLIIAAAELGLSVGLISPSLYSTLILLAIVSVLLSPTLARAVMERNS